MSIKINSFLKNYWSLITILIIGTVLRLYHLTAISLWHDEAFSALLIKYSWGEMIHRIGLDVHPPMYYIFLRFWHYLLGDSLVSLRGFSVFFGVLTIIAAYFLVKEAFKNEKAAFLTALLLAINPFQIQYVTEARMYTMGAFFAVLAAYFLVKALRNQRQYYADKKENTPHLPKDIKLKKQFTIYYLLFSVSVDIIILTHYYLLFTAAALCFYALVYHWHAYKDNLKRYGWLLLSFVVIGLGFLPWLKVFLFQFRQVSNSYWIPNINVWSIPNTLWQMLLALANPSHLFMVLVTLFSLYLVYYNLRKISGVEKWLVLLNIAAPFAGAILFLLLAKLRGQTTSVYLVRYFLFAATFYTIMVALWLESLRPKKLAKIFLILLIGLNLFAFGYYWRGLDIGRRTGMAGAAKYLETNIEPGQKLYVGSSFEFFNFKYYLSQWQNQFAPRPLLYSGGTTEVDQLPHYAGTAILTNADLLPNFNQEVKNSDTVWLLWTNGFGGSKPQIPQNWTQINEKGYEDVRPYPGTWIVVTEYKVN